VFVSGVCGSLGCCCLRARFPRIDQQSERVDGPAGGRRWRCRSRPGRGPPRRVRSEALVCGRLGRRRVSSLPAVAVRFALGQEPGSSRPCATAVFRRRRPHARSEGGEPTRLPVCSDRATGTNEVGGAGRLSSTLCWSRIAMSLETPEVSRRQVSIRGCQDHPVRMIPKRPGVAMLWLSPDESATCRSSTPRA
jgi:hypothetical protein